LFKVKSIRLFCFFLFLVFSSSIVKSSELREKSSIKGSSQIAYETLDNFLVELKRERSLTSLCKKDLKILECQKAIGGWKPEKFERVKLEVPACFDQCMLDAFGFYRDSQSGKDIPAVRTKDFDASAPSRGFEATLFPVAVKIFRYEGCAGCALTYQYPTNLVAEHGGETFNLPLLTRGGYYLPSTLRKSILKDPSKELQFRAKTTEGEFIMEISKKSISEYTKMLKLLEYDFEL
tara:strand:+ start:729 stop:1433 length:705 start_codon:yes stop_codon:yes gene_type:complete